MRAILRLVVWGICGTGWAWAASPVRVDVPFSVVSNTALGQSVYVVGNHPDLGSWNPAQAVRLNYLPGNTWSGTVAVQAGTALEFKFIGRHDSSGLHCEPTNVQWAGGVNLVTNIPSQPAAPYPGKTVFYYSGWTNVVLVYSTDGVNFATAPMTNIGAGRGPGESLFHISGVAETGVGLQFIPSDGGTNFDHAPYPGYGGGDYYTELDVLFLQDGQVYNYWPPAAPSAPYIVQTNIGSSIPGIPGRNVRIYVPRGYAENTWKRYPVLYMHDGNNLFSTNCNVCSWNADTTATREISQGRMRETILVGMDNNDNRFGEYCPPGDKVLSTPGVGNAYGDFIVHNVRPTLDFHYRTLNDPANTGIAGSSLGGLISAYLSLESNVFGLAGVFSPSFWTATNFVGRIDSNIVPKVRMYLDWGTAESDPDMWNPGWEVYRYWLLDGYSINQNLRQVVGCGAGHNESAWAARLPGAYQFLLNPWDEPNQLARQSYPPSIRSMTNLPDGRSVLAHDQLRGLRYVVQYATNLAAQNWSGSATSLTTTLPWTPNTVTSGPPVLSDKVYFRIISE